jgi:hypothetical protein
MHRNIARAYDCLQDEHYRIRTACVKILAQNDKSLESASCFGRTSIVHGITTICFYTRSAYLAPSGVVFLI